MNARVVTKTKSGVIRVKSVTDSMLILIFASLIAACSPVQFNSIPGETGDGGHDPNDLFSNIFKLAVSEATFEQPQLENNNTTVAFQVVTPQGDQVPDLKETDFKLTENAVNVSAFKLNANSKKIVQTVDIVFAVDVTGSMAPTIESAKASLIAFIKKTRKDGYRTRMGLLTFGDYTVKKCDRFFDNDPNDPKTEVQVNELISEISKLRAITGPNDPGGSDLDENPMRALIDAAAAPWAMSSQRFVVMVTDAGFHYSPGNEGDSGRLAPQYTDALKAIATAQMQVFAATPSLAGYNKKFQGSPGIVEASQGEWFDFNKLVNGQITLDNILASILNRVLTTYVITYTADESTGLDPGLPLDKRNIVIALTNGSGPLITAKVVIQNRQSNLPNGRDSYKKKFKVASKRMRKDSVRVHINGQSVASGYTVSDDGEVEFDKAPGAKARIRVTYQYESLADGIQLKPILLSADADIETMIVEFNGLRASPTDFDVQKTLDGTYSVRLNDRVLSELDPYQIRQAGGLAVHIRKP